jgi:hypothetical protein
MHSRLYYFHCMYIYTYVCTQLNTFTPQAFFQNSSSSASACLVKKLSAASASRDHSACVCPSILLVRVVCSAHTLMNLQSALPHGRARVHNTLNLFNAFMPLAFFRHCQFATAQRRKSNSNTLLKVLNIL